MHCVNSASKISHQETPTPREKKKMLPLLKFQVRHKHQKHFEQYFTRKHIAQCCIDSIPFDLTSFDLVVDPCCGNGAFSSLLPQRNLVYMDIDAADESHRRDFLTYLPPRTATNVIVVGSPPFGRHSQKAIDFFNHAAQFANVIAFLVSEITFYRQATDQKLDRRFRLLKQIKLPRDSFFHEGEVYSLNAVFQIWVKG